jgi:H+/Cl- antiporter ClcA
MSKPTITRLFVGSITAIVAAIVLGVFACIWAFANNVFQLQGPDVVGLNSTTATWATIAVIIVSGLAIVGGAIGALVAWIGALLNTSRLEDKTWFILLLVLGLLSFGFFAMVAYVIAGPDGTLVESRSEREHRPIQPGGVPA